ncbi:hypothetical protein DFQ28_003457 [Apophysomyces sp. BC1034]|nr:hypothetical protein DFQ29_002874 [Apophysomyces sp. BC1021]KAG0189408.1 hypothetical protein DFQ28_003457 [Apophysomyces sp. BC1034]
MDIPLSVCRIPFKHLRKKQCEKPDNSEGKKDPNPNDRTKSKHHHDMDTLSQDRILSQLIDMGFEPEAAKVAMVASDGHDLQGALDVLIDSAKSEQRSRTSVQARKNVFEKPEVVENGRRAAKTNSQFKKDDQFVKTGYERTNKTTEGLRTAPPRRTSMGQATPYEKRVPPVPVDDESSSDEDPEIEKVRIQELKRLQEIRRKEYIEQMKTQKHHMDAQMPETPLSNPRTRTKLNTSSHPQPEISPKRPEVNVNQKRDEEHQRGNELFKLGQFAAAKLAYSRAMTSLPPGHDQAVLLCNNRAAARLQLDEYEKCILDCNFVIGISRPRGDVSTESEGIVIRWRAQLIKALQRKAVALEKLGNHSLAIVKYEEILSLSNNQNEQAQNGIKRCKESLSSTSTQAPATPTSTAKHMPNFNGSSAFPDIDYSIFELKKGPLKPEKTSKAVEEMRAKAAQKEAEEAEKLAKTDGVNSRLNQWKTGKEKNLRILLVSLDAILWPGAKWTSVQMNDLLEPKRCKILYMKAIAKVHPDKLPLTASVEERMLASGVFVILNEAWDLFKNQYNL